jgi:predicted AlkP superfamily phosphohydrolase/phosphomutase
MTRPSRSLRRLAWLALFGLGLQGACAPAASERRAVILIGLDGAALPVLRELVAAGRLPSFARLIEHGALGPLASIYAELPFSPERGGGYWSPLVWNSIATGKRPGAHGVIDFRLPNSAHYRRCTLEGATQASVRLPHLPGASAIGITRTPGSTSAGWSVEVGGRSFPLAADAAYLNVPIDASAPPSELRFRLEAGAEPAPLCLQRLRLLDRNANTLHWIHFVADGRRFVEGWDRSKVGHLRSASTDHREARAIWNIASDAGARVAVVGWRDSWPAEPVAGYYVSDHLGLRFAGGGAPPKESRLTHPEDLEARVQPLLERAPEIDARTDATLLDVVPCTLHERDAGVARVTYWSDWLRHRLALMLWEDDPSLDLLAVYYNGTDPFGHMFQPDRAPRADACRIEPPLVDRYYAAVDAWLGDWIERLGPRMTLVLVTDHGMGVRPDAEKGEHEDNGFVLLAGHGIASGPAPDDAHVLDVAPTLLYLLDLPLAEDMPGDPLWSAIDPGYRARHLETTVATHETRATTSAWAEPDPEAEEAILERLRALGYVD